MLELGPDDVADCRDASVAGLADVFVWSERHPTSRFPATSTTSLTNFSTNNYYHHHPLLLKGSIPSKLNTLSSTYYYLQKTCSSDQQKFQLLIPTEALRVHRPRSQLNHLQSQLGTVEPRNRYTSLPINRSKLTIFRPTHSLLLHRVRAAEQSDCIPPPSILPAPREPLGKHH